MRVLFATDTVAVLTLASPAFASGVSDVTVEQHGARNAAGARTTYVVGFTTSATGALSRRPKPDPRQLSGRTGFGG